MVKCIHARRLFGCRFFHAARAPAFVISSIQQQQKKSEVLDGWESERQSPPIKNRRGFSAPSSTFAGRRVSSYTLSPIFEEFHSLWQWRTVLWGSRLHVAPFLIYCAPGVPMLQPFLHHTILDCIASSGGENQSLHRVEVGSAAGSSSTINSSHVRLRRAQHRYAAMRVPSPIGALHAASIHLTAAWVDEFFHFLERGVAQTTAMRSHPPGVYNDVFESSSSAMFLAQQKPIKAVDGGSGSGSDITGTDGAVGIGSSVDGVASGTSSQWSVPLKHRNVIGCGLAEVVVAIDRYAAMLARRDITYAKACWGVLADSKADVQPYLRNSALAIERELIAATAAHESMNAALGDPMRRLPMTLVDYPSIVGW